MDLPWLHQETRIRVILNFPFLLRIHLPEAACAPNQMSQGRLKKRRMITLSLCNKDSYDSRSALGFQKAGHCGTFWDICHKWLYRNWLSDRSLKDA